MSNCHVQSTMLGIQGGTKRQNVLSQQFSDKGHTLETYNTPVASPSEGLTSSKRMFPIPQLSYELEYYTCFQNKYNILNFMKKPFAKNYSATSSRRMLKLHRACGWISMNRGENRLEQGSRVRRQKPSLRCISGSNKAVSY